MILCQCVLCFTGMPESTSLYLKTNNCKMCSTVWPYLLFLRLQVSCFPLTVDTILKVPHKDTAENFSSQLMVLKPCTYIRNWGSHISMVIRPWAGQPRNGSAPIESKRYLSFWSIQNTSGAPSASCWVSSKGSFSGVKWAGQTQTTHCHLLSRLRVCGAIPLLLLML